MRHERADAARSSRERPLGRPNGRTGARLRTAGLDAVRGAGIGRRCDRGVRGARDRPRRARVLPGLAGSERGITVAWRRRSSSIATASTRSRTGPSSLPKIGRSAILWIDLEKPTDEDFAQLVDAVRSRTGARRGSPARQTEPRLADHGEYLHVTAIGLSDERETAGSTASSRSGGSSRCTTSHSRSSIDSEISQRDPERSEGSTASAFWPTCSSGR